MSEADERAAVRVEFSDDEIDLNGDDAAQVDVDEGTRALLAMAGLVVLAILAGLILELRPDAGETSAGTERREPAPASNPVADATSEASEPETIVADSPRAAEALSVSISEIVEADVGYLALGESLEVASAAPRIFRSLDGQEWTEIETTYEGPALHNINAPAVQHNALTRVDDGFVLLAVSFSASEQDSRWTRLHSTDGAHWTQDPAYNVIDSDRAVFGLSNAEDSSTVVLFDGAVNAPPVLTEATNAMLAPEVDPFICVDWVDLAVTIGSNDVVARVRTCDGERREIATSDLKDPDQIEVYRHCLSVLTEVGSELLTIDVATLRPGGTATDLVTEVPISFYIPIILSSGELLNVAPNIADADELQACDGLVSLDFREREAEVAVLSAEGERPMELPPAFEPPQAFLGSQAPVELHDEPGVVLLPSANGVWRLDLATEQWTLVQEPPVGFESTDEIFTSDWLLVGPGGRRLFALSADTLHWAEVGGPWSSVSLFEAPGPGEPILGVLSASGDDDVVYLATFSRTYRVDLAATEPASDG